MDIGVVPCTALRDNPAVVGARLVASGVRTAAELDGSIDNRRLVSADGSTRFVSIGGGVNVAGTSELDCTAAELVDCCVWPVTGLTGLGVSGLPLLLDGVNGLLVSGGGVVV